MEKSPQEIHHLYGIRRLWPC